MNGHINDQQLETFLIEAELVQKKIKDLAQNKISVQQFDRIEKLRQQDRRKRQQYKLKKQRQAQQLRKKGRSGKGISKNFIHFCKFCHIQYDLETPKCLKCQKDTMTLQQRQKQLEQMVLVYKNKKMRKQQRKQKWQMWKKTKAMMWKKTSTNYTKWEVYTSSEQQQVEQNDPILPKDDPNFKALEMDMLERKKKRQIDTKKANALKQKGNKAMKQGQYQQAMEFYTLALQHIKDNKAIYTNRALAFIKLKKYKKAIKDCDDVIDYIDCFEKFGQCPDLAYKAYSRKAIAHKQRKQYKQALEAINNALKMIPNDCNALKQKKQIQNFFEHNKKIDNILKKQSEQTKNRNKEQEENDKQQQKVDQQFNEKDIIKELAQNQIKEQKKENKKAETANQNEIKKIQNPIQFMKKGLKEISENQIENIFNFLLKNPDYKNIFINLGGIKTCLNYILQRQKQSNATILVSLVIQNNGVAEKQIWEFGPTQIQNKIQQVLNAQTKLQNYQFIQDLFQFLVPLSLHQKYRNLLAVNKQSLNFIIFCFPILITKHKKNPSLLSSFIIYCSNLCVGEASLIKAQFQLKIDIITTSLIRVLQQQTKNMKKIQLKKNIYNLLSNLMTRGQIRQNFYKQKDIIKMLIDQLKIFPRSNQLFKETIESLLSFFVNITFQIPKSQTLLILKQQKLHQIIYNRFLHQQQYKKCQIFNRSLQVLSKLDYKNIKIQRSWIKKFQDLFNQQSIKNNSATHALRFFNNIYSSNPQTDLPKLQKIVTLLDTQVQILFCNACTLFGVWIQTPQHFKSIQAALRKYIIRLINIAKQKVGNLRKSSGILLAKIAKDEENKKIFSENHGMQVLKSVSQFILDRK